MRGGMLFAVCLALATPALAQDDIVEIPFSPSSHVVLDIEEVRTRTSTDESGPNSSGRISATLEINNAAGPVRGTWTTTRIESGGHVFTAATPGAAQLLVGEPISLTLAEDGGPLSVEQWEPFHRRIMQTIEQSTPEAERTPQWRAAIDATSRMFLSMDATQAARFLFQEVSIMSICQHTALPLGRQIQSETVTPNPFGGDPIRTLVSLQLTSVDPNAGVANIRFDSSFDPESAAASVRAMVERMARETNRPPSPEQSREFENAVLVQNTHAECVVDLSSGIVRSVDYEVSIDLGANGHRSDRRTIRVVQR